MTLNEVFKNIKLKGLEFIKKANTLHKNKYDYSLVEYKNCDTKVKIICPVHGVFEQTPYKHLKGQGCPICAKNKKFDTNQFIKRVRKIYGDRYDYSLVDYKNANTKVKIICPIHGIFERTPRSHWEGKGCPICAKTTSNGENLVLEYLKKNNIKFVYQKKFEDLKDKKPLSYDFYLPEHNLLIEYNGEQHYRENSFNKTRKDFLLQKHHDWMKRKYAQDKEINLLTITYKDDILLRLRKEIDVYR